MVSSRAIAYLVTALALSCALPVAARADAGVVNALGTGRDTAEAITNLLRTTVARYFKEQPLLTRNVLQNEILPNASSFVQSYKINDGSRAGAVTLSANVDLDVIHGLLSLTPKNLGEADGAKALVIVRGAKFPESAYAGLKGKTPPDPFAQLAGAARERFARRDFGMAELSAEDQQATLGGDDITNAEALRTLGAKAGARVVLVISARFESYENENAHNKEERVVLSALLVDVKTGNVMGRGSVNVVEPKTRRDQYFADLQRNLVEESKDLLQDVLVSSGRRLGRAESHDEYSVVRVLFPSNPAIVYRFKALLETAPGVRSVTELSVKRGKFDFAVRPAMPLVGLAKAVASLQSSDLAVARMESIANAGETDAHVPDISVKLEPKEVAAPANSDGGGQNAAPTQSH